MSDINHARMMLTLASMDLKALEGMGDPGVFDEGIVGFHAQQAVEKALKAWLSFVSVQYPKTHDLELLLSLLANHGQTVPGEFQELTALSDFAVQYRYEAFGSPGEELDRAKVAGQVTQVINHVMKFIS